MEDPKYRNAPPEEHDEGSHSREPKMTQGGHFGGKYIG